MAELEVEDSGEIDALILAARPSTDDVAARYARADVLGRVGPPTQGVLLGRFEVRERLGVGGFSVVYQAWDPILERDVAVKVLRLDAFEDDPRGREGWLRECRALARLDHPNVVTVFEAGVEEDQPFMIMELIGGDTLRSWLESVKPTWREVVERFVDIARGLAAIHEVGIVHRDFKPDNVLFDAAGRPRVADLGLAVPDTDGELGRAGTLKYMAPEQRDAGVATVRSDQYALCLTLAEAVSGGDPDELRGNKGEPSGAPAWLRRTIQRGLSIDPEQRWDSVEDVVRQLESGLARRRRVSVAATGTVLAAGMFGLSWSSNQTEPCERPPPAWSDARQATVREAMLAVERPYVDEAWAAVEQRLDAYADELSVAHCETTPAELLERREACLTHAEESLEDVVGVLERPTPQVVNDALSIVFALPHVAHCTDPDRLASNAALAVPERWQAVNGHLRSARRSWMGGDLPGAVEAARAAVGTAESFGDDGLRARALLQLGQFMARSGEIDGAIDTWRQAYWLALETGDDGAAARLSEMIARQLGANLRRFDDGLAWARTARAWNVRMGATPQEWIGTHDAAGSIYAAAARYDEAVAEYDEALQVLDTTGVEAVSMRATVLAAKGQALLGAGRVDEGKQVLREALELVERVFGPEHPEVMGPLNGLASIAVDTDPQRALELARRVLKVAVSAHDEDHPNVVSARANIAIMLESAGRMDEAQTQYEQAIESMRRIEHPLLGQVLDAHAGVLRARGRLDDADRGYEEAAQTLSRSVGEGHPLRAAALRHWADNEHDRGRFDSALAKKTQALELLTAALGSDHPDVVATRAELSQLQGSAAEAEDAL